MNTYEDLIIAVGEYTDRNGVEKKEWQKVGVLVTKDDGGKFIVLNKYFNPAGVFSGEKNSIILSVSKKDKKLGNDSVPTSPAEAAPLDDEIPF